MAHVTLPKDAQGIRALFTAFPGPGRALSQLAQALLRGPSSLTAGERELLATHVSSGNHCRFCTESHAAAARALLGPAGAGAVDAVLRDAGAAPISDKLKALLAVADHVRSAAQRVPDALVQRAKEAGADAQAIHDTVLIAAAFCMFNRYVEGLGIPVPSERAAYDAMGEVMAAKGYVRDP